MVYMVAEDFSLGMDLRKSAVTASAKSLRLLRNGYVNAVQVYPFASGALYQIYAAPGQVTDVALQEGEQLVGSGPVAAGDTLSIVPSIAGGV